MNKISGIILGLISLLLYISFLSVSVMEDNIFGRGKIINSNNVNIKVFTKSDCEECTKLDNYLKVYKKAGVEFGNIYIKEYGTDEYNIHVNEYNIHVNEYNIEKLPFIVFSKELSKYETIANSWNDTFGYKNNNNEFIVTDIIPPYFNLKTKKIEGLIDMIYIGDNSCLDCYKKEDIEQILLSFGIIFKDINNIDIKSEKSLKLIEKYSIKTFPTVILSSNMNLYKNFSYFWNNIGTVEEDGKYILREPMQLGLKIKK